MLSWMAFTRSLACGLDPGGCEISPDRKAFRHGGRIFYNSASLIVTGLHAHSCSN